MTRCERTLKMNSLVIGCVALMASQFALFANGQENVITIICHECWPYMEDFSCANLESNDTLTNCTNLGVWDLNVTCFSAYINMTGTGQAEKSGVYRGCAPRHINYTDYCDFYKNFVYGTGIDIMSCAECYEDGCNTHKFTEGGELIIRDEENGGERSSISWCLTLLLMFIMKLTNINLFNCEYVDN